MEEREERQAKHSSAMKCGSRENCSYSACDSSFLFVCFYFPTLFQWISEPLVWLMSHWRSLKFAVCPIWLEKQHVSWPLRDDTNSSWSNLITTETSKWNTWGGGDGGVESGRWQIFSTLLWKVVFSGYCPSQQNSFPSTFMGNKTHKKLHWN